MRKAIVAGLLLLGAVAHAQELKKGTLIGTHNVVVKLAAGVTMEQWVDFYNKKVIPAFEKSRPRWKAYPLQWVRGEKADGMALLIVIPSQAERDKYYNADGSENELGKAANAMIDPVFAELTKLGTITADRYTDWVVY